MLTPIAKQFYVFGTFIQITAYGSNAETAVNEAVKKLYELDDKMSVFKSNSEISKINENAGNRYVKVSDDTYFVIKKAAQYGKISHGALDITIRPLTKLWNIGKNQSYIPDKSEIDSTLKLVNYEDILMDEKNCMVKLSQDGESIDLGGIAKGYAADEVKNILIKHNIDSAVIDLGGNIYALGLKPDKSKWNIGIQNPLKPRGNCIGIVSVENKSVVTSGNYERYSMINGKMFQHIINPKTGYPCKNGVISTTIVSDDSIDGDALSTCAYVSGVKCGMELMQSIKGVDAIFITEDKKIYATPKIKENFKLINNDFIYGGKI